MFLKYTNFLLRKKYKNYTKLLDPSWNNLNNSNNRKLEKNELFSNISNTETCG